MIASFPHFLQSFADITLPLTQVALHPNFLHQYHRFLSFRHPVSISKFLVRSLALCIRLHFVAHFVVPLVLFIPLILVFVVSSFLFLWFIPIL